MEWFTRKNLLLFVPKRAAAWLILGIAMIYAVYVFRDIDSRSHTASDTLINFAFKLFVIYTAYSIVAWLTTSKTLKK